MVSAQVFHQNMVRIFSLLTFRVESMSSHVCPCDVWIARAGDPEVGLCSPVDMESFGVFIAFLIDTIPVSVPPEGLSVALSRSLLSLERTLIA